MRSQHAPSHFHAQSVLSWPWAVTHRLQRCQAHRDGWMTGLPRVSPSQHDWLVHPLARPKEKGINQGAVGSGVVLHSGWTDPNHDGDFEREFM